MSRRFRCSQGQWSLVIGSAVGGLTAIEGQTMFVHSLRRILTDCVNLLTINFESMDPRGADRCDWYVFARISSQAKLNRQSDHQSKTRVTHATRQQLNVQICPQSSIPRIQFQASSFRIQAMTMVQAPDPCDIPDVFEHKGEDDNLNGVNHHVNESEEKREAKGPEKHDADFDVFAAKAETVKLEEKLEGKNNDENGAGAGTTLTSNGEAGGDQNASDPADSETPVAVEEERASGEKPGRYVTPKDFELLKVIGMGAFGKVLQVRNRQNKKILAMKVISKRILKHKSEYIENIHAERDILTKIRHPFVVTMHCSFQTKEKLFIIMDFLAGGELFLRLGREGIFREKTAAFYLGEIILALDHLHTRGVLHRDLKPENILLCSDGHVCVTDFGLARDFSGEAGFGGFNTEEDESRARTVCGTQEYMSPEMLSRKGYGRASDYWSLGCIAYEMMSGLPPFESKKGAKVLFSKIMTEKVKMPHGSTAAACKLLKGLLNRDATKRWGAARSTMFEVGGAAGLKAADFFNHLDWDKLEKKQVEPPDCKPVDNDEDLRHFYDEFKEMPLPRSVTEMSREAFNPRRVRSDAFRGFSFVHDDFALPDRSGSEVIHYWNNEDGDGESESDTASSKHDGEGEQAPKESDKKKRPPRKKKKKNQIAAGQLSPVPSATNTPEPSEAGDEKPVASVNGDVEKAEPQQEAKPDAAVEETKIKMAEKMQLQAPAAKEPPTPPPKQQEDVWAAVSSSKKTPQRRAPVQQKSTPRQFSNKPSPSPQQQPPARQQQPMAPQETYRPAPGSWAAKAQEQAQAARQQQQPQSRQEQPLPSSDWRQQQMPPPTKQIATLSVSAQSWQPPPPSPASARRTWGENSPPSPSGDWRQHSLTLSDQPAPSGDWRDHSLTRNSPAASAEGRPVRQVAAPEEQQQFWPNLDAKDFPAAAETTASVPTKRPQGAWAARAKN